MEITKEMQEVASQIAQLYKDKLTEDDAVASGKLRDFKVTCEMSGSFFEVYFHLQDYWKYVEKGRKAGSYPPISAIRKWIDIKPVIPRAINGKVPTKDQLAYLISRKIYRVGIDPRPLLQEAIDSAEDLIDKLVALIDQQLELEINQELEEL